MSQHRTLSSTTGDRWLSIVESPQLLLTPWPLAWPVPFLRNRFIFYACVVSMYVLGLEAVVSILHLELGERVSTMCDAVFVLWWLK